MQMNTKIVEFFYLKIFNANKIIQLNVLFKILLLIILMIDIIVMMCYFFVKIINSIIS